MKANGFTLVELLVACLMVAALGAAVAVVVPPVRALVATAPVAGELAARLRFGLERLTRDLRTAGAGPLPAAWPAVEPWLDAGRIVGVTIRRVPAGAPLARLAQPAVPGGLLVLAATGGCAAAASTCGFAPGDDILVTDGTAHFVFATVSAVYTTPARLATTVPLGDTFGAGAVVTLLERVTYRVEPEDGLLTLTRAEGAASPQPVADHLRALDITLLAAADAPALESSTRLASFGPPPPLPGMNDARDSWPAGENCVFATAEGVVVPRLGALGPGSTLVGLAPAWVADGPWCPDVAMAAAFDADLLRVRAVRVRMRLAPVEATLSADDAAGQGRAGVVAAALHDVEAQVTVSLRSRP